MCSDLVRVARAKSMLRKEKKAVRAAVAYVRQENPSSPVLLLPLFRSSECTVRERERAAAPTILSNCRFLQVFITKYHVKKGVQTSFRFQC